MKTKLHLQSKMIIPDPYVVRVTYENTGVPLRSYSLSGFRKYLSQLKSMVKDTWGYSNPEWETERQIQEFAYKNTWIAPNFYFRSYWVFTNELDALQCRITIGDSAQRVFMWPHDIKFTITEYIDV